jgi:hypothetical protein
MSTNHIAPRRMEDWIRKEVTAFGGASVIWKDLVKAFPLLVKWLVWKVGRGNEVKIGQLSWMGCIGTFRLSGPLKHALHNLEIYSLADAADQGNRSIRNQGWKTALQLDLQWGNSR